MFGLRKRVEKIEDDLRVVKCGDEALVVNSDSPLMALLTSIKRGQGKAALKSDLEYVVDPGKWYGCGELVGRQTIPYDALFKLILQHLNLEIKFNPGEAAHYELAPQQNPTSTVPCSGGTGVLSRKAPEYTLPVCATGTFSAETFWIGGGSCLAEKKPVKRPRKPAVRSPKKPRVPVKRGKK